MSLASEELGNYSAWWMRWRCLPTAGGVLMVKKRKASLLRPGCKWNYEKVPCFCFSFQKMFLVTVLWPFQLFELEWISRKMFKPSYILPGGGNSNIFKISSRFFWGNDPIWLPHIFSNGLVSSTTTCLLLCFHAWWQLVNTFKPSS